MLELLVTSLAAYRITRFITSDEIPFGSIRRRIINRWVPKPDGATFIEGIACSWCIGAWVSFALTFAVAQIHSIPLPGLYALAVATIAGVISHYVED